MSRTPTDTLLNSPSAPPLASDADDSLPQRARIACELLEAIRDDRSVLDGLPELQLCTGYELDGERIDNSESLRNFQGLQAIDTPVTLEELSESYGVSRERIRQIEVRAFEKLQKAMQRIAGERLLPGLA